MAVGTADHPAGTNDGTNDQPVNAENSVVAFFKLLVHWLESVLAASFGALACARWSLFTHASILIWMPAACLQKLDDPSHVNSALVHAVSQKWLVVAPSGALLMPEGALLLQTRSYNLYAASPIMPPAAIATPDPTARMLAVQNLNKDAAEAARLRMNKQARLAGTLV